MFIFILVTPFQLIKFIWAYLKDANEWDELSLTQINWQWHFIHMHVIHVNTSYIIKIIYAEISKTSTKLAKQVLN